MYQFYSSQKSSALKTRAKPGGKSSNNFVVLADKIKKYIP